MIKLFKKWLFPNWQPVWTDNQITIATYVKTLAGAEIPGTEWEKQIVFTYTIIYSDVRNTYKLKTTGENPERWDMYKTAIAKLNELKGIKI